MSDPWCLGNDIVDLKDPRCVGKASEDRFLQRVFSPRERDAIRRSPDPELALWLLWAGKEATFKTVTKARGAPPVFRHDAFPISFPDPARPSGESPQQATFRGTGRFEDTPVALLARLSPRGIHVASWLEAPDATPPCFHWKESDRGVTPGRPNWRGLLQRRFSDEEWRCVTHEGSALTRLAARASLARKLGLAENRLEIRCGDGVPGRRVPFVFLDGKPAAVDLSLSHHGLLLAWAFLDNRNPSMEPETKVES
ncbi:4'-phosphopantetheinyl transferase superfamily protein [Gemmatimonadota bacterium]